MITIASADAAVYRAVFSARVRSGENAVRLVFHEESRPEATDVRERERLDFKNYNSESAERKAFNKLLNKAVWRGSDCDHLEAYPKVGTLDANRYVRIAGLCDKDIDTIQENILDNRGRSDTDVRHRVPPRLVSGDYCNNIRTTTTSNLATVIRERRLRIASTIESHFSSGDVWNACQFEKYKYLVDIGGGGGTSWKSTFRFLAMPGVLFHHETMMRFVFMMT